MPFSEITKHRAYESIVAQVEGAIDDGTLKPGDRLPGERRLMEQFGVSRPTVREAMRVLQATGVLSSDAGDPRGAQVLAYSPTVFRKALGRLARTDGLSRVELLQFRLTLESAGCRLAAVNRTEEHLERMREARAAIPALIDGGASAGTVIDDFQATIRRASGNRLIEITGSVLAGVMGELVDARLGSAPAERAERIRHADRWSSRVLEAITRHDGAAAARAVKQGIVAYYGDDLDADEQAAVSLIESDEHAR